MMSLLSQIKTSPLPFSKVGEGSKTELKPSPLVDNVLISVNIVLMVKKYLQNKQIFVIRNLR
jgi:hypothetical protein